MREPSRFLRETHLIGSQCRELMIDSQHHPLLRKAPFVWIGFSVLRTPYRIVRLSSVHSHLVACVEGTGRTYVQGSVQDWTPGKVLLAPVGKHHAFEVKGRGPWTIAWVFFDDTEAAPVLPLSEARLIEADASDFASLIRMLTREATGPAQASMIDALTTALETTARRLAGVQTIDQRLWRLWAEVEAAPAHPWTVAELASRARMSEEHLRRLCHRSFLRSPMEHLTWLRMRRAATLLRSTSSKLEEIAQHVGYASVYSFSSAFRRCNGTPPGKFRAALERQCTVP